MAIFKTNKNKKIYDCSDFYHKVGQFVILKDKIKQDLAKQIFYMSWVDQYQDFGNFEDKIGKGEMVINDR